MDLFEMKTPTSDNHKAIIKSNGFFHPIAIYLSRLIMEAKSLGYVGDNLDKFVYDHMPEGFKYPHPERIRRSAYTWLRLHGFMDNEALTETGKELTKLNPQVFTDIEQKRHSSLAKKMLRDKFPEIQEVFEKHLSMFEARKKGDIIELFLSYYPDSKDVQRGIWRNILSCAYNQKDILLETIKLKTTYLREDFQKIITGPPGTGKSHQLSQRLIELKLKDETTHQEKRAQVTRVTCHAEMTSADFIGAYQPTTDDQGKLHYRFEPGPFTRLLHRALRHLDEQHVLIIEELNRANTAAMFAEAFQLLDRVEDETRSDQHWSTYPTSLGTQVWDYLTKRNQENTKDEELTGVALDHLNGAVRLPPNFAIWATLNTADQSVFPLDTAFKRRWSFEYLGVDDGEKEGKKVWHKPAWNPLIPGYNKLHWQDLRQAINKRLEENEIEEDRHLGAFFLTRAELHVGDDTKAFLTRLLDKVVSYLREDVVRVDPAILFAEVNTGEREYVPGYAVLRRKALEKGLLSIFKGFIKDPPAFDDTLLKIDTYRQLIDALNKPNDEPDNEQS